MTAGTVAKNSFYVLIARAVDTAGGILLIWLSARYLVSHFGIEVNGQYAFMVTLIGLIFTMANAGLAPIIIRDIARDRTQASEYLTAALSLRIILGMVSSIIIVSLALYLPLTREMRIGLFIAILSELINVASWNYINLFNAYERMDFEAVAAFLFRAITLGLTLLVMYLNLSWLLLFAATAFGNFARLLYLVWRGRTYVKHAGKIDWKLMQTMAWQALPLGIALLLTQGYLRVDVLILKGLTTYKEVAYFYYPYRILLELNILPLALTSALFPVMSRAAKVSTQPGNENSLEELFIKAFKFYLILSLPIMIFGFLYATPIITTIFTDAFAPSGMCLKIMIWSTFFVFIELLMNHSLIATGHQRVLFMSSGSCLAVNFITDFVLIKYYHLGSIGASIGTLSSYTVLFFILLYYVNKTMDISKLVYQLPRPLIAGVVCGLLFYPLRQYAWYLMIPLGFVIYIVILFLIRAFSEKEISMFKMILRPPGPVETL